MKWLEPEFIERVVLPLVIAFGMGVVAAGLVRDHREARALDVADQAMATADEAIAIAQVYREAYLGTCSAVVFAETRP
ncbi:hypothetical protein dqs_0590 [Azoarcus olearius]|uniref:hypothetical protein n=1 Tax=Azoarcus sp. (strain BH72) TaxID=418699 RepID=UPI00080610AA|nr:hypothetical protein [Azoarcus olearius]ANQ83666.1 hypothetical protein dqs_0590 [Azoarcus olearius]